MSERFTAYRDLAFTLTWREITVRYKRSVAGVVWALAEPALNVAVYAVVFGAFLGAGTGVHSYPLFALFGVLPWLFFSTTVDHATNTLLEHAPLVRKVKFPR